MKQEIRNSEEDNNKANDCMKPNNPEARRFNDTDDYCHEQVDGK